MAPRVTERNRATTLHLFLFFSGGGAGLAVEFPACRAAEKQKEEGSGWRHCAYKQATPHGV